MSKIIYTIVTGATITALSNAVTASIEAGYSPLGGAQFSGSSFIQTMMLQYSNDTSANPERLSKWYRSNITGSDLYSPTASYL